MNISEVSPPESDLDSEIAARLKRNSDGLVPAIVQDVDTREVLMLGYMNDQALHMTLTTGRAWYWSRSRGDYWRKGDTSGNTQDVVDVALDCDNDTILVTVRQHGPACHTGTRTCFTGRELTVTGTETSPNPMKGPDA